jgi:hypothetical protein
LQVGVRPGHHLGIRQQLLRQRTILRNAAPAFRASEATCTRIWVVSCSWIGTGESC